MNVLVLWIIVTGASALAVWLLAVLFVAAPERLRLLVVLLGVSAIAATAGITGGLSRDGAVGEVVAAALGLMGVVVVYLFGTDPSKGTVASVCALAFSLALVTAYFEAAARRGMPESYAFWRERCATSYTDKDLLNDPITLAVMDQSIGTLCAQIFNNERQVNIAAPVK